MSRPAPIPKHREPMPGKGEVPVVIPSVFLHTAKTGTTLLNSHALTLSLYKPFESAEDDGDLTDLRLGNWDLCKTFCGKGADSTFDYFDWIRSVDAKGIQPRIFCTLCEKKMQTTTAKSTTTITTTTQKPSSVTPSTTSTSQPVTASTASGDNTSTASTSA
ncbi:hypothetical protein RUM43_003355 [Polyplax serrata]|uniref:Uncharacterized protein n=1 Tax=Polyplax serrata TaxID=468196 RepID=A0AAN8Q0J3_POLSC